MSAVMEERLPHITFEMRPIEDRNESVAKGRMVYKDVEFAIISPQGGNSVVEREVNDDIKARFGVAYEAWKKNEEPPLNGTSVKMWPSISPSEVKNLLSARILTVEDLAAANEQMLQKVGIGARALQAKAKAWMNAANNTGKVAEEVNALKVELEAERESKNELMEVVAKLKAEVDAMKGKKAK